MEPKKDFSLVNCAASSLLAYFFTVPLHEFFHLATSYAYGDKCAVFSAGAVEPMHLIDYQKLTPFHRIMVAGGSASILNVIIGLILVVILLRKRLKPASRMFLTQLMGGHLTEGFGYFMFGGLIGMGDWGNVFACFEDAPGFVTGMRITLTVLGVLGYLFIFFILNHLSYFYIKDPANEKQRFYTAVRLHLPMFIVPFVMACLVMIPSPMIKEGAVTYAETLFWNMAWIAFFWGFMFTWKMVKPPKKSRWLYDLPKEPLYGIWIAAAAVSLFDLFVLGPGIRIH